ncbi:hypothetical protein M199_gp036 [Halogranum tailed virus 1]|uniref:Uncharacterized protein n=1 Tax=Halogranum tailed virus 1 TaxID=1273749 RepID=R4TGJ3_9CAUD|nr:hypothetical protein M199_gp036 [Halogranum tailed virus 1]AGM11366.1 hypothetical protein HGTV1_36 [Halogranum tailed virus 1]
MTIFPTFIRSLDGHFIELKKESVYQSPSVNHRIPTKAEWVIRNSTYYEPNRIHYEE